MTSYDHTSSDIIYSCVASAALLGWSCEPLSNGVPMIIKPGPWSKENMLSMLSGVHGDEHSGPIFLMQLLHDYVVDPSLIPERGLIIVPLFNDEGWDKKRREWNGLDLNRQFKLGTTVEHVEELKRVLIRCEPTVHWDIHEDDERLENYVYGYGATKPNIAQEVAERLRCPFERSDNAVDAQGNLMTGSSEEFTNDLGIRALTTETNPSLSMEERLEWLRQVYEIIVEG